jgi:hypothetical protein
MILYPKAGPVCKVGRHYGRLLRHMRIAAQIATDQVLSASDVVRCTLDTV